jgi:hypothetical protein
MGVDYVVSMDLITTIGRIPSSRILIERKHWFSPSIFQCLPRILAESVTSLSCILNQQTSTAWPVLHYLLTKEGRKSTNGANPSVHASSPIVPMGEPFPGPGLSVATRASVGEEHSSEVQGPLCTSLESPGHSMTDVEVKVEPVDVEGTRCLKSLLDQPTDVSGVLDQFTTGDKVFI